MSNNYNAGPLFALNYNWASWMLIAAGLGIAFGMWRRLFRRPSHVYEAERGTLKRHAWPVAIAHWVNAIGFLLALYSGASLIHVLPRSVAETTLYMLHYTGLTLMLLSLLAMITYQFVYGGHSFRTTWADVCDALLELVAYTGLIGDGGVLGFSSFQWPASWRRGLERKLGVNTKHRTGKYLPVEKVLSLIPWIIVVTFLVLTGLIKGLHYLLPMPAGLVQVATMIHDWCVYAGGLMLVFHVAALLVVRTNWPLLASMFTTRVSARYAEERHPEWFKEAESLAKVAGDQRLGR